MDDRQQKTPAGTGGAYAEKLDVSNIAHHRRIVNHHIYTAAEVVKAVMQDLIKGRASW